MTSADSGATPAMDVKGDGASDLGVVINGQVGQSDGWVL
jgi:hypothetical protein